MEIRHSCGARLFDSIHQAAPLTGPSPDVAIKCPRCSREQKKVVVAKYRLRLPHSIGAIEPTPIYCADTKCLARLCDLALPYTITSAPGDLEIKCHKCKRITKITLAGVVKVC